MESVRFLFEFFPHPRRDAETAEVVFDPNSMRIVSANYQHNGYPVIGRALRQLGEELRDSILMARGWVLFRRHHIRVLENAGA